MANPDLQNYINTARQQGLTNDQIRQNLVAQGWNTNDVNQALSSLSTSMTSSSSKMSMVSKVLLISIGVIIIGGVAFGYFKYKNKTESVPASQINNPVNTSISVLTAEKIKNLKTSSNDPDGDYFIASKEEQKNIVAAFVADNSKSDSTYLYIAANTAYRIGEIKEAAFLFYAAQIRKSFDYKRYGLGQADGNNIQTYLGFLNQTTGQLVNPAIFKDPRAFSEVADMISKWQVIPDDDALYPKDEYGTYVLSKDQWSALAEQIKQDFKVNFVDKYSGPPKEAKNDCSALPIVSLPANYPSGVPVYTGAKLVQARAGQNSTQHFFNLTYCASATKSDIAHYYLNGASSWNIEDPYNGSSKNISESNPYVWSLKGGTSQYSLSIVINNPGSQGTLILYQIVLKN